MRHWRHESQQWEETIASGWREAPLGDMLTILRGVSYKNQDADRTCSGESVPILRATNIDDGKLNFTGLSLCAKRSMSVKSNCLTVGDIVIAASSGSRHVVGKAASLTVPWTGSFGAFCYGLRPHLQGTASYILCFSKPQFIVIMSLNFLRALTSTIYVENTLKGYLSRSRPSTNSVASSPRSRNYFPNWTRASRA